MNKKQMVVIQIGITAVLLTFVLGWVIIQEGNIALEKVEFLEEYTAKKKVLEEYIDKINLLEKDRVKVKFLEQVLVQKNIEYEWAMELSKVCLKTGELPIKTLMDFEKVF